MLTVMKDVIFLLANGYAFLSGCRAFGKIWRKHLGSGTGIIEMCCCQYMLTGVIVVLECHCSFEKQSKEILVFSGADYGDHLCEGMCFINSTQLLSKMLLVMIFEI